MTDKYSQLDEIERLAEVASGHYVGSGIETYRQFCRDFFKKFWLEILPGGLYYEMRRELQRQVGEVQHLRRENDRLKKELTKIAPATKWRWIND